MATSLKFWLRYASGLLVGIHIQVHPLAAVQAEVQFSFFYIDPFLMRTLR